MRGDCKICGLRTPFSVFFVFPSLFSTVRISICCRAALVGFGFGFKATLSPNVRILAHEDFYAFYSPSRFAFLLLRFLRHRGGTGNWIRNEGNEGGYLMVRCCVLFYNWAAIISDNLKSHEKNEIEIRYYGEAVEYFRNTSNNT